MELDGSGEGRTFAHDGTQTDRSCAGTTLCRQTLRPQAGEMRGEHVEGSKGNDEQGVDVALEARAYSDAFGEGEEIAGRRVESAEPYLRKCVNQAGGRNLLRLIAGRRLAAGAAIRDRGSKGPHMDG